MEIEKLFDEQLKDVKPISSDILPRLKGCYFNGDKYILGDKVLYALILKDENKDELTFDFKTLTEKHFNLFEEYKGYSNNNQTYLPVLKLR